jgi:hypothetical protein
MHMGQRPMAVVGEELQVHGLDGLRVIDASVMPAVTSTNTNAPTIMIAEKGAAIIQECGTPEASGVTSKLPRPQQGRDRCGLAGFAGGIHSDAAPIWLSFGIVNAIQKTRADEVNCGRLSQLVRLAKRLSRTGVLGWPAAVQKNREEGGL